MTKSIWRLAALAAAGFFAAAAPAAAQGVHGSLAISENTDAFGYSYNYATPADAQSRAMAECAKHAQDCKIYANFENTCVTVARSANGAFGWSWGYSRDERSSRAISECTKQGGTNCALATNFCTGRSEDTDPNPGTQPAPGGPSPSPAQPK